MNYPQSIQILERVICGSLDLEKPVLFHEYALLRDDLGIDSVAMLRLLLQVELSSDWELPDDAFVLSEVKTVRDLALKIAGSQPDGLEETPTDAVTVHCLVSCFCDALKQREIDFRPMYFGIWDAPFGYENGRLLYHYSGVDHGFIVKAFESLYGAKVEEWYERDQGKQANIDRFASLLARRAPDEAVVAMVDMAALPGRENKFLQSPFPHYALFEETSETESLLMRDVDFRWQGELPRTEIFAAMRNPTVEGGYRYFAGDLAEANAAAIDRHCQQNVRPKENVLTKVVRKCVEEHRLGGKHAVEQLGDALRELPVLAIRKYAYEHAFAYYWLRGCFNDAEFDHWCDQIGELAERYKQIQYAAMKYSLTRRDADYAGVIDLLGKQDSLETRIKTGLCRAHASWRANSPSVKVEVAG